MIIDVIDAHINDLNFRKSYESSRNKKANIIYKQKRVDIKEVDKKGNDTFTVKAEVDGNYDDYEVNLSIKNNFIEDYYCDCPDYSKGNICKHILATAMEVMEPHYASTIEGQKRLEKQATDKREQAYRLWQLKQEEERKRLEYERKYYFALNAINEYKKDAELAKGSQDNSNATNVKEIYQETRKQLLEEGEASQELATCISIEPQIELSNNSTMEISFKIGQTTKYVLKDLDEFCDAFNFGKTLTFGKKLKFEARKENFNKTDRELLDYILDYGEILKYNARYLESFSNYYYYSRSRIIEKSIIATDNKIDEFFEITNKKPILVELQGGKVAYTKTNEKLEIRLDMEKQKNSDDYVLKINLENYMFLVSEKKIYVFYKCKIYTLDISENEGLIKILDLFENKSQILIPQDKINDFSTYIFPKMEKYLAVQNIEEKGLQEVVLVNKLASKMYLDIDDKGYIIMELKFCYNNFECNILDSNYTNYMKENGIERNVIEERKVLRRIFRDGFELVNGKKHFILKNLDDTYEFLYRRVEAYMNDYEILVTEKFKNKQIRKPSISSVSVKLDNGLLELDISKVDFDIDELRDVLKNYSVRKKYYRLKNGDFLSLDESEDLDFLSDMSNSLDIDYSKINNGVIKLPVNRSIYLDQLLSKNKAINTSKNDEFNKLVNNIENKNFSDNIKIEKNFEKVLRDYQKTGYKWLKVLESYHLGGILADDMGLGKTLQIIALLSSDIKNKNTSIVVCPSSLVLNWKAEVEKWCPKIKVGIIKGSVETRKELINDYKKYDLLVTSYDLLKRDVLEYEGKNFKYIIADEAQYIKNFTTQNATALKSLEGETKFALTGTPIENSVSELWSIFDFIMPGYLYTYSKFKKKLETPILQEEDKQALQRLKTLINPFILRRIKKDVLTELPEKNITIMTNEMTDEQQKIYMSYFVQTKKELAQELSENGFEKSKFKILMLLTRLRQICCHPSLFLEDYDGESGKLNQCIDIITDAIESGHRILLFSSYTSMFDIIEKKLNEKKVKYYKLTGSTQVSKRVEMVENFNKNEDIKIFLISLKAGGTGLNLTGADVVIHYDPWWNVSSENQATDRAYRIGQKNSVQVYKLITANSIEEKINKLQEKKAELSNKLLSTEETFINKLSKEEIMELFE